MDRIPRDMTAMGDPKKLVTLLVRARRVGVFLGRSSRTDSGGKLGLPSFFLPLPLDLPLDVPLTPLEWLGRGPGLGIPDYPAGRLADLVRASLDIVEARARKIRRLRGRSPLHHGRCRRGWLSTAEAASVSAPQPSRACRACSAVEGGIRPALRVLGLPLLPGGLKDPSIQPVGGAAPLAPRPTPMLGSVDLGSLFDLGLAQDGAVCL
jgi:hypothetical protein